MGWISGSNDWGDCDAPGEKRARGVACPGCGTVHEADQVHPELCLAVGWAFDADGRWVTCPYCASRAPIRRLVNLTPHAIVLRGEEGDTTVPPSGAVARVSSSPGPARVQAGVPVPIADPPRWGAVEGLPEPALGTLYVVSALVAAQCGNRGDVVSPGTGPADGAVRDADGRIVAVTRLVRACRVD